MPALPDRHLGSIVKRGDEAAVATSAEWGMREIHVALTDEAIATIRRPSHVSTSRCHPTSRCPTATAASGRCSST
jgi:hypothetical protein